MNTHTKIADGGPLQDGDRLTDGAAGNAQSLLVNYLSIFRRRKFIILGCVLGALLVGLLVTLLMTPRYTASATIAVQRESRNFAMVQGADNKETSNAADLEFYQTQYGLLQARSLAERVATVLRLYDNQQFLAAGGEPDAAGWFAVGKPTAKAPSRTERTQRAAKILLKNLVVTPQRLSSLINLSYTSPDPKMAQVVTNVWGDQFIGQTLERRFEATSYARKFLEQRLKTLRDRIDESERQVVGYASRENIINLPAPAAEGAAGGGERSMIIDDLATLNRELGQATADRVTAQSRLGAVSGSVPESLSNTAIAGLRQKRAEAAADYGKLMTQFEPGYPPAQALKQQINELDQSIAREEGRVGLSLRQTYTAALERESALKRRVTQLTGGVLDLRRRSIQYNIYLRDANTNRQLYDALLQRYKEIGVAGGIGVNNISLIDRAQLPQKPSRPWLLLNMIIALFAGISLGVATAIALEQIDQGVTDPSEVERILRLPLLGTIPKLTDGDALTVLQDRKSALTEAYMSVQTTLGFSTDHGIPRTVAVTSTRPAEGKTTTSYALAITIARAQRRVMLIDGDMRSPSLHHLLGLDNAAGLSNFLSGNDDVAGLLRRSAFDHLDVMTAGPHPPSAPELLSSNRFEQLLAKLLEQYDHIVIDSPPVMGLADAPLLGSRMEGVLFVVEARHTQRGMVQVALDRLRATHSPLLGIVLTKFESRHAHYGYGYDYGYGYGART